MKSIRKLKSTFFIFFFRQPVFVATFLPRKQPAKHKKLSLKNKTSRRHKLLTESASCVYIQLYHDRNQADGKVKGNNRGNTNDETSYLKMTKKLLINI